jgi:hypothetical protein
MNTQADSAISSVPTNGPGAAALLAAGIGSLALAAFDITADKSPPIKAAFIFWKPTGALSGVTTSAIVVWLVVWAILHARWKSRTVDLKRLSAAALIMLVLGLMLTFPPLGDLF